MKQANRRQVVLSLIVMVIGAGGLGAYAVSLYYNFTKSGYDAGLSQFRPDLQERVRQELWQENWEQKRTNAMIVGAIVGSACAACGVGGLGVWLRRRSASGQVQPCP